MHTSAKFKGRVKSANSLSTVAIFLSANAHLERVSCGFFKTLSECVCINNLNKSCAFFTTFTATISKDITRLINRARVCCPPGDKGCCSITELEKAELGGP